MISLRSPIVLFVAYENQVVLTRGDRWGLLPGKLSLVKVDEVSPYVFPPDLRDGCLFFRHKQLRAGSHV